MSNIAIIPARGGSKRIPHKNIKPFLGKPILAYSIQAALQSGVFDEVMVSTDDEQIAAIATYYGASVPFMRSQATANDYAGLAEVITEVLDRYEQQNKKFDNFCCILATAPLISSANIMAGFAELESGKFDSVYPIVAFSYPILRSLLKDEDGYIKMRWDEYHNARSQDLEPAYHDSGTFYWMKSAKLKQYGKLITPKSGGIVVDEICVQDIDTATDWALAELKYKLLNPER